MWVALGHSVWKDTDGEGQLMRFGAVGGDPQGRYQISGQTYPKTNKLLCLPDLTSQTPYCIVLDVPLRIISVCFQQSYVNI